MTEGAEEARPGMTPPTTRPSIRVERTVEWPDTDAAGHYHHSSVIRWVEAAESELHLALGLPELFGHVPHVHYEVDYLERLWFRDQNALLARSLSALEARLPSDLFFRANRNTLVNLRRIRAVTPSIGDGYDLALDDGSEVEVSRRQARELRERMAR